MTFSKTCPVCKEDFLSLINYVSHIKKDHEKVSPEEFVKTQDELKWSFRENT